MRTISLVVAILVAAGAAQAAEYDSYGGWKGLKIEARDRFYLAERKGVWWFVAPSGLAFYSKGVNTVRYTGDNAPALGHAPYGRATSAKYGSAEKWAAATAERLRQWGFNTIGSWADRVMFEQKMPYTMNLNLATRAGANWQKGTMPDFFSQAFRETVRTTCREQCQPRRNDRYLLGYFTDNELAWRADWRGKKSLLDVYLEMPERSAGRRAALGLLAERGRKPDEATAADAEAFLALAADQYFRTCHDAIRAADPNHLILGCRFAGYAPEPVVRAMKGRADVVSYNNYSTSPPVAALAALYKQTGAPILITEFGFKAMDSGLPNTKGAGKPLATQKDRADGFERYVKALAALPYCVGFHWFEYCDEPQEGRFDGENSNYGLVRVTDEPWEVVTERMEAVNPQLEAIHSGQTKKKP